MDQFKQPNFTGRLRDVVFMSYHPNLAFGMGVIGGPVVLWLLWSRLRRKSRGKQHEKTFWFTFVFGATPPKGPEINIQQPVGSELTDSKGKKSFGTVKVGKSGPAKTFTIKNTGTKKLTKIAVALSGKNAGDFTVTAPSKTSLAPGASTTFKATFKPKSKGTKNAVVLIKSNDKDESPFDVKVTGLGAK